MASHDALEKLPPQNVEAEMAVIGCMLLDRECISRGIEALKEDSFYKDAHQKIFAAITRLFDNSKEVDLVTLMEELKRTGSIDEVGGPSYLASLASGVPTTANFSHYADIVRDKSILRKLINAATGVVSDCYDTSRDVRNVMDKAEQSIFDVRSEKVESRFTTLKDVIKDSIETIDGLYQRKQHVTGIATGIHELDTKTAGFQKSDLIIVAARPSMGKSALVACIVEHVALVEKKPVAFFSLEMSKEQLAQRFLCSHARVDAHKVRTGFLSQSDWPRLVSAAGKLSEAPIYIDDATNVSALELRAKARRLKAKFDIQMIVMDYLQLMAGSGDAENRQQEISEISRSLKAIARELNVPLIAISQLSRAVENRADHRPQLSDLRESGAIEQDADVVLLLLREEFYNETEENKGLAELIIAKQRNGPLGTVKMAFLREYVRFENLASKHDEYVEVGADMERV